MPFNPKWLIGRTITRVDMHTQRVLDNGGPRYRTMHFPVITLDNGAELSFFVEEDPNGAEYGVDFIYHKPTTP